MLGHLAHEKISDGGGMSKFLSARRLPDKLGWLIESPDFLICTSREQVSSFVPLKAPHLTHSYWDDITLAGLMSAKKGNQLMVVGSGMGSFLPLLHHLSPGFQVRAIDMNGGFLEISRRVAEHLGFAGQLDLVTQDAVTGLSQSPRKFDNVFIDLYSAEGILPLAGNAELHAATQSALQPEGLVWINIADRLFETDYESSSTKYFVDRVLPFYGHGLLLRRKASTTAVFSRQTSAYWRADLESLMAAHIEAWSSNRIQILEIKSSENKTTSGVLEFSRQKARAKESSDSADGYLKQCLLDVQKLSQFDLVRLSRSPSVLLGGWP